MCACLQAALAALLSLGGLGAAGQVDVCEGTGSGERPVQTDFTVLKTEHQPFYCKAALEVKLIRWCINGKRLATSVNLTAAKQQGADKGFDLF